ncbi:MAG: hypothetical protein JWM74_5561 [Myxococcaceae bacterium]|nr:hypothetical protein [Myxococcaceae bacterium]
MADGSVTAVSATQLTPINIRATVKAHSADISSCFDIAKLKTPSLAGSIKLTALIDPRGHVTSVSITKSTVQDPFVESCLVHEFGSWRFPNSGGAPSYFDYTFVFD